MCPVPSAIRSDRRQHTIQRSTAEEGRDKGQEGGWEAEIQMEEVCMRFTMPGKEGKTENNRKIMYSSNWEVSNNDG